MNKQEHLIFLLDNMILGVKLLQFTPEQAFKILSEAREKDLEFEKINSTINYETGDSFI